jgi:hypothetical protein
MLSVIPRPAYRSSLPYICLACRINYPLQPPQLRFHSTETPTPSVDSPLAPLEVGVFSPDGSFELTKPKGGRKKKRAEVVKSAVDGLKRKESAALKKTRAKQEQLPKEFKAKEPSTKKDGLVEAEPSSTQPPSSIKKRRRKKGSAVAPPALGQASLESSNVSGLSARIRKTTVLNVRKLRAPRRSPSASPILSKKKKEGRLPIRQVPSGKRLRIEETKTVKVRTDILQRHPRLYGARLGNQRRPLRPALPFVWFRERIRARAAALRSPAAKSPESSQPQSTPQLPLLSPSKRTVLRVQPTAATRIIPVKEALLADLKTLKNALLSPTPKRARSPHYTPKGFKTEEDIKEINVRQLNFRG